MNVAAVVEETVKSIYWEAVVVMLMGLLVTVFETAEVDMKELMSVK